MASATKPKRKESFSAKLERSMGRIGGFVSSFLFWNTCLYRKPIRVRFGLRFIPVFLPVLFSRPLRLRHFFSARNRVRFQEMLLGFALIAASKSDYALRTFFTTSSRSFFSAGSSSFPIFLPDFRSVVQMRGNAKTRIKNTVLASNSNGKLFIMCR